MKKWWNRLIARIDALALRERFLLFAAVVAVLGLLTHLAFIAPLNRLQAQRAQEIDKNTAAMESQRNKLVEDIARGRRARVAELEAQVERARLETEAIDREIATLSVAATDVAAMRAVLTRSLGGTRKVALLSVNTAEATAAAPAGAAPGTGSGVDITLAGAYLDLMEYLATLEAALPQARWSALRLTAETVPPQLAVRIATPRGAP